MMARDPMGNRPLCLGKLDGGWVAASESCAFDHLGATFIREIEPGEVIYIDAEGLQSLKPVEEQPTAFCVFEYIYFARPDSVLDGKLVYPVRMNLGRQLAKEHPAPNADVVIGVPDSATAAAIGYSQASGIPFVEGLVKNRYVGRTFIQPDQRLREIGVHLKFNPLREVLQDRSVVLVDDSIVRGTTTTRRDPDAAEGGRARGAHAGDVAADHASVLLRHRYGDALGADRGAEDGGRDPRAHRRGLARLPERRGPGERGRDREGQLCMACFTGEYPRPVPLQMDKLAMEPTEGALDRHESEYTLPLRRV